MTPDEIYEIWAPTESEWSQWVKPVLFAHSLAYDSAPSSVDRQEFPAVPLPHNDGQSALVLDLPGAMAVQMTGDLIRQRYRPIPLYNSCPPPKSWSASVALSHFMDGTSSIDPVPRAAVDVLPIIEAIVAMTPVLKTANLPSNAPPAFLLDDQRRTVLPGYVRAPGAFDNRSVSLPTDFPSSNFLLSRGIRKIVLITQNQTEPEADLSHTLLRWQRAGISIAGVTLAGASGVAIQPQPIPIRRPPFFRIAWYALMARLGLRPNLLGGFGGVLPESGGFG